MIVAPITAAPLTTAPSTATPITSPYEIVIEQKQAACQSKITEVKKLTSSHCGSHIYKKLGLFGCQDEALRVKYFETISKATFDSFGEN